MSDIELSMSYSDDGGRNWSAPRIQSAGETGQFSTRIRFQRLGMAVQRVYRFECSSPRQCAFLGAVMVADTER